MSKRIACFMAAIALIVASAVPAYAVTPQEGWYISGTMERDGINYYIIDNKVNDQKWWVDLRGGYMRFDRTYESGEEDNYDGNMYSVMEGIQGFGYFPEAYHGFSETNWRIDNDWVLEVSVDTYTRQYISFSGSHVTKTDDGSFMLCAFDKSKLPTITASYSSFNAANARDAFQISQDVVNAFPWSGTTKVLGPSIHEVGTFYFPISNFGINGLFSGSETYNDYGFLGEEGFASYNLDACSINDLVLFPLIDPDGEYTTLVDARVAFRFLCPVDKAPAGMAVGDRWPKVWPLEVEIEEAYKEYYDRMFSNGQITNPGDIDTSFGQLNQWKDTWELGFNRVPADGLTFAGNVFSVLGSSLTTWLMWIFIGCLLLVFINKAVH